jgi:hypothetical protein
MAAKGTIKSLGFMFIFTLITTMDAFEAASRERISQSWSHVVGGESFPSRLQFIAELGMLAIRIALQDRETKASTHRIHCLI